MKSLFLTILASLSIISCGQETIKGNGKLTSITKQVSANFDRIGSSGSFDIEIQNAPQDGKIKLEGESNILEKIVVEVENGKLKIEFKRGYNFRSSKSIKITLKAQNLKSIALSGSGNIRAHGTQNVNEFTAAISGSGDIEANVKANLTTASISGSGDIKLSGKTDEFKVGISGSGDVHAYNLNADDVNIGVAGSGDAEVTVNNSLLGAVAGSGDISYKGNPSKVKVNSSGSGDVIHVK